MADESELNYVIVYFEMENSIEVVPKLWIHKDDGILKCAYPSKNARKYVKKNSNPEDNWMRYDCTIKASFGKQYFAIKIKKDIVKV
jgi:hypothetical protein